MPRCYPSIWIGSRAGRAVLLTLCAATAFAWQHDHDDHPKDFKSTLETLLRASRENLAPLKTVRIEMRPGNKYWYEVELPLTGSRQCRIFEHPRPVYQCEMAPRKDKTPTALYEDLVENVRAVLSAEDWKPVPSAQSTRFEPLNPRRDAPIEIRLKGAKSAAIVEFLLYGVDRDGIY